MDGVLGEFLAAVSEDTNVLVMSDHGAGPCYKAVFINKWLEEKGLLRYVDGRRAMGPLEILKKAHHVIKNTIPPAGLEWMSVGSPHGDHSHDSPRSIEGNRCAGKPAPAT